MQKNALFLDPDEQLCDFMQYRLESKGASVFVETSLVGGFLMLLEPDDNVGKLFVSDRFTTLELFFDSISRYLQGGIEAYIVTTAPKDMVGHIEAIEKRFKSFNVAGVIELEEVELRL